MPVPHVNTGDTAWMLTSAALVMFMTPGLALFYGGLVRAKNVLGMGMQSFFALGLVTVLWVLVGYTLAFGPDVGGVIGGLLTGSLASSAVHRFSGGVGQLGKQAVAAGVTMVFSFVVTLGIL